jgi:putative ABC transport system substrate-binding protein
MRRRRFIALGATAVALGPVTVLAQRRKAAVIGFLNVFSPGPAQARLAAFRQGLSAAGYVEGRNLTIEYRWADHHYDRLPGFAADLVGRKVDRARAIG